MATATASDEGDGNGDGDGGGCLGVSNSNSNLSCTLPLGLIAFGELSYQKNSLDFSEHPSHHFCNFFVKSRNHRVRGRGDNSFCVPTGTR